MQWSHTKPTIDGYYWIRHDADSSNSDIVYVEEDYVFYLEDGIDWDHVHPLDSLYSDEIEWYGPLEVPT